MFYGMLFGTDSILIEDDIKLALGAFKDGDTVASWAREAVAVCYIRGIMVGDNGSVKPTDLLSRAQLAQVFRSFYETQLAFALDELPAAPDQPSTPVQPSTPEQPSTRIFMIAQLPSSNPFATFRRSPWFRPTRNSVAYGSARLHVRRRGDTGTNWHPAPAGS